MESGPVSHPSRAFEILLTRYNDGWEPSLHGCYPYPMTNTTVQGPGERFDFARPFRFVFEDPQWMQKIGIGGLFYLACFVIIGWFFVFGYMSQLARNVVAGAPRPLPEWEDFGTLFNDGVKLVVVAIIYSLPGLILAVVGIVFAIVAGVYEPDTPLPALAIGCMVLLMMPFLLLTYFFMPAALTRVAISGEIGSAFEFREIWDSVRRNIGNYFMAIVVYIIANAVGQVGVALLCVGMIFTMFWSWCISTYAFAEAHRIDPKR